MHLDILVALGIIVCLSFLQILIPQITRYVIDVVIPEKKFNLLPWVAAAILLISLLIGVLNFFRSYMMSLFGQRTIDNLRNDLYKHIEKLSISFFNNIIKSFGNEDYKFNRFSQQSRNYMEANIRAVRLWSVY